MMILVSVTGDSGIRVPRSIDRSSIEKENSVRVSWIYWKPDFKIKVEPSYWPGAF